VVQRLESWLAIDLADEASQDSPDDALYRDAESQILLCELRYPQISHYAYLPQNLHLSHTLPLPTVRRQPAEEASDTHVLSVPTGTRRAPEFVQAVKAADSV
jgi:hypothetical protein